MQNEARIQKTEAKVQRIANGEQVRISATEIAEYVNATSDTHFATVEQINDDHFDAYKKQMVYKVAGYDLRVYPNGATPGIGRHDFAKVAKLDTSLGALYRQSNAEFVASLIDDNIIA